jgi:hypothetical protein
LFRHTRSRWRTRALQTCRRRERGKSWLS